jgi:hypothetical protein
MNPKNLLIPKNPLISKLDWRNLKNSSSPKPDLRNLPSPKGRKIPPEREKRTVSRRFRRGFVNLKPASLGLRDSGPRH